MIVLLERWKQMAEKGNTSHGGKLQRHEDLQLGERERDANTLIEPALCVSSFSLRQPGENFKCLAGSKSEVQW